VERRREIREEKEKKEASVSAFSRASGRKKIGEEGKKKSYHDFLPLSLCPRKERQGGGGKERKRKRAQTHKNPDVGIREQRRGKKKKGAKSALLSLPTPFMPVHKID